MTTGTLTFNENTTAGKILLHMLKASPEYEFKVTKADDTEYDHEYVEMIKNSQEEARQGKVKTVKTEDLWK